MDISKILNREELFSLDLRGPDGEDLLCIRFMIRSAESDVVREVLRKHGNMFLATSRTKKLTAEKIEAELVEKAAAAIASWDWGEHEWRGQRNPELTFATAQDVLTEAGWIYDQVAAASEDRMNFIQVANGNDRRKRGKIEA
jgi:hypothetical protein